MLLFCRNLTLGPPQIDFYCLTVSTIRPDEGLTARNAQVSWLLQRFGNLDQLLLDNPVFRQFETQVSMLLRKMSLFTSRFFVCNRSEAMPTEDYGPGFKLVSHLLSCRNFYIDLLPPVLLPFPIISPRE